MSLTCTRCQGSGFLNINQVDDETLKRFDETGDHQIVIDWAQEHDDHDVGFCDCCGDGDGWYDVAGEHYNSEDPAGKDGPYAYNGGLCKCH